MAGMQKMQEQFSTRSLIGTLDTVLSLLGQRAGVSSGTLAFIYMFLSLKGHIWTLTS